MKNVPQILKQAKYTETKIYSIVDFATFQENIYILRKQSNSSYLTFPKKSKRNTVKVSQGMTNINWLRGGQHKSTDFNDIEKQYTKIER